MGDSDNTDNTRRSTRRKVKGTKVNILRKVAMPGDRWTLNEKRKLYNALCKHGVTNLEKITADIGTRTIDDVRKKIFHYEKKTHLNVEDNMKLGINYELVRKCDDWIKRLRRLSNPKPARCSALEVALKIIELYEDHPDPKDCYGIDFKQVYGWMYDCCSGNPSRKLDVPTSAFLVTFINSLTEDIDKSASGIDFPGIVANVRLKLKEGLNEDIEVKMEKEDCSPKTFEESKKKKAGSIKIKDKIDEENEAIFNLMLQDPNMNPLKFEAHLLKEN